MPCGGHALKDSMTFGSSPLWALGDDQVMSNCNMPLPHPNRGPSTIAFQNSHSSTYDYLSSGYLVCDLDGVVEVFSFDLQTSNRKEKLFKDISLSKGLKENIDLRVNVHARLETTQLSHKKHKNK